MSDIAQRLRNWSHALEDGARVRTLHEAADALDAERALADDLADMLSRYVGRWKAPEIDRVLARYQEARGLD